MQGGEVTARKRVDCEGKVAFNTFARAQAVARSGRHDMRMNAYACGICGKFHVGSAVGPHHKKREVKRRDRRREMDGAQW